MTGDAREMGSPSPLTVGGQGLALLALEGLSVGLFVALLVLRPRLVAYVGHNRLSAAARNTVVLCMLGSAALFCAAGAVGIWRRPGTGAEAVQRSSRRLLPLLLLWLAPLLLNRWVWAGRDLSFLTLASLLGLGGYAALRAALAPPSPRVPAAVRRLGDAVRAAGGRAPRLMRAWPLGVVSLAGAAYAAFFAYHTVAHHRNLMSASFDLGIFDNLMWNLVNGGPLFKSSPALGPSGSHLGRHATFLAYVIAPLYALAPRAETLLVIQAALIGAAAIPLFLLARRHVGDRAACVLALAYLLYPPVHGANLYDFHFLALAPGFVWTALYLLEARRDRLAAVAVALTLLIREDVAAGMVLAGLYLMLSGDRPRAGLIVAGVATVYFVGLKFIAMPSVEGESSFLNVYKGLLPSGEGDFLAVLKTVLGNPAYTLATLLRADKLVYLLQILAPLAFLPLRRPLALLLLVPGVFFTILETDAPPLIQISFHYTAHWTAYVFPAAVFGLAWIGRSNQTGETGAATRRCVWLTALVAATLVCSHQYGVILQQDTARAGYGPYRFGTTALDRARREELRSLLELLPPRAKVVATETLVPQVSNRPDAYTLRVGIFDADYLLFSVDRRDLIWHVEREPLRRLLEEQFGVVAIAHPFVLAQRGYRLTANAGVLARLRE